MMVSGIAWKSLTLSEKMAWTTYAAGTPIRTTRRGTKTLDGHLMYQLVAMLRMAGGLPVPTTAPTSAGKATLTPPVFGYSAGALTVQITTSDPWVTQNGSVMLINAEAPGMIASAARRTAGATVGVIHGSSSSPPGASHTFTLPWPWPLTQRIMAEARVVDASNRPTDAGKISVGPVGPPPPPAPATCPPGLASVYFINGYGDGEFDDCGSVGTCDTDPGDGYIPWDGTFAPGIPSTCIWYTPAEATCIGKFDITGTQGSLSLGIIGGQQCWFISLFANGPVVGFTLWYGQKLTGLTPDGIYTRYMGSCSSVPQVTLSH